MDQPASKKPSTELLPPIFDQLVMHYEEKAAGRYVRADIVDGLLNGIVNALADNAREVRRRGAEEYRTLITSDRLSGASLSRGYLIHRMGMTAPLSGLMLEIALLLIEAQIDLSLESGGTFEVQGISFGLSTRKEDIASWCRAVLPSALHGVSRDSATIWSRLARRPPEGLRILMEGLPMSATIRQTVPYKIELDKYLIDPVLQDGPQDPGIRLLHISDLHLVEEITEKGRRKITPALVASHDINTARQFIHAVRDMNPRHDVVLATGDLTTDGERGSFKTVLDFFQSASINGMNPNRIAIFGLHDGQGNRLLLPGNHDRFGNKTLPGQRPGTLFEEVLSTPRIPYPYVIGYRKGYSKKVDGLTLLFVVFDSNLRECPQSLDVTARVRAVAQGEITGEDIERASEELKRVAAGGFVPDLSGQTFEFDPKKTVRIAVLHHHPVFSIEAEKKAEQNVPSLKHPLLAIKSIWREYDETLMAMKGGDKFLGWCLAAGIQIVLFGHHHDPCYRMVAESGFPLLQTPFGPVPAATHCFGCPSTLECKASINGFYMFDFLNENQVSVDLFLSMRDERHISGPFALIPQKHQLIDLSNPKHDTADVKLITRGLLLVATDAPSIAQREKEIPMAGAA